MVAAVSGVPRCQRLTMRGYPEVVSEPGPKSVATKIASRPCQAIVLFASGRVKPSATNCFLVTSNSRTTLASAPPRDSDSSTRSRSGSSQLAPFHTQFSPSCLPSASRSSTTSQAGCSVRYESAVVRRHRPRGFCASCHRL